MSYVRSAAIVLAGLAITASAANADPRGSSAATPVSMEGNFSVVCTYSHTKAVDPIMDFGQRPSPHAHDFFGAINVHARSTRKQLRRSPTTCQDTRDTSGYWEPEPFFKGRHVPAKLLLAYYYGGPDTIFPPFGLKMMAGNPQATHPLPTSRIAWSCGNGSGTHSPRMNHPYKCLQTPGVVNPRGVTGIVIFPSCWDGMGLKPMDVKYPVDHQCPPGTYLIPQLQERYQFPFMDGTKLAFVTGRYWTFHANFFQSWHGLRLRHLVAACLRRSIQCGKVT